MQNKNFYITTPIYYPSNNLHIGHSYCTVFADVIARYQRMTGKNVIFSTGIDEHGQKIQNNALKSNVSPKEFVDVMSIKIKSLWKKLNISYDYFVRTTDDYHIQTIENIIEKLFETGDIYKGNYTGKYCIPCESFWSINQTNNLCPECNRKLIDFSEEAYFFKLSNYKDKLINLYKDNPNIIFPNTRLKEMINFVNSGLDDLCISRKNLFWGIKIPFDHEFVVYVWFEALLNYISILGYKNTKYNNFAKFWPCDLHIIGKEITRFHLVIWPAILMALNIEIPKQIISHGWILFNGEKMSKSIGNIIDPNDICDRFGVDSLRYFLIREFDVVNDTQYSIDIFINRINIDLCNNFGNLVSRTFNMIDKFFSGTIFMKNLKDNIDINNMNMSTQHINNYIKSMNNFMLKDALISIMNLLKETNKYIDTQKPWDLYKNQETKKLYVILSNILENIRLSCIMFLPFIPETSLKVLNQMNYNIEKNTSIFYLLKYGLLDKKIILNNTKDLLFPRIINNEI